MSDMSWDPVETLMRVMTHYTRMDHLLWGTSTADGFTPMERRILICVVGLDRPVSPTMISKRLCVTPQAVTKPLRRLEDLELVERSIEGRKHRITSTEYGRWLARDIAAGVATSRAVKTELLTGRALAGRRRGPH